MSAEQVKIVLGRAVREPEFRGLLFRDPGQAIAGYELTEAELSSLKGLTPENFDSMAATSSPGSLLGSGRGADRVQLV